MMTNKLFNLASRLPLLLVVAILFPSTTTAVRRLEVQTSPNAPHHHAVHQSKDSQSNPSNNATSFSRNILGQNVYVDVPTSPDDHIVKDLPLLDDADFSTTHWAGLLPASADGDKYLFYWMFAPDPEALQAQQLTEAGACSVRD